MKIDLKSTNTLNLLLQVFYLLFFTSFIFSFRAISSLSILLILFTGIIKNRRKIVSLFNETPFKIFLAGCVLFYLLQFISLIYTHNLHQGWNNIRLKSGLVAIPMALIISGDMSSAIHKKLSRGYCIILCTASLYCIGLAFFRYSQNPDSSLFFYHTLVKPISQHAVYFSIYLVIALIFLWENAGKNNFIFRKSFHTIFIIFFSVLIFLLSSKLVIVFYLIYLLYYFIGFIKNKKTNLFLAISLFITITVTGGLVFITKNPISERFDEIWSSDINIVRQEKFSPGYYFTGLQFRLLEWKIVTEILNENSSWLRGVSSGDAQAFLNQQYISKNMYTGKPGGNSHGFIGYNTHDEFLQTLLQTGIPGLIILLLICFSLVKLAWNQKNRGFSFIILILISYLFSESVFETQYGILLFTFFPLFFFPHKTNKI